MKHTGQRWFSVCIGFGFALGLLLLGNSAANYVWVSQRIVVDQVRKDLSAQATAVDKVLHRFKVAAVVLVLVVCVAQLLLLVVAVL